jgi:hypothetical protein
MREPGEVETILAAVFAGWLDLRAEVEKSVKMGLTLTIPLSYKVVDVADLHASLTPLHRFPNVVWVWW